ncbi:MAG TPA: AAA family ATPase [Abditibacterium sp.]|jgi:predicted ATPase
MHLTHLELEPDAPTAPFPFNLPLIRQFQPLRLESAVTFFTGENGTGKSTLLEAIAASANLPTAGGDDVENDDSLAPARELGRWLRLGWTKRTRRGFFLRTEDFFAFQRRVNQNQKELGDLAARYEAELETDAANAEGIKRARGHILAQKRELAAKYGENADARSHGEAFLHFFEQRLVPNGLYLLDEPEAPLSPLRQLAFLSLLKRFVAQNCQFVITTHSPVLMAFPGAVLLDFNACPIAPVAYDDVEHVGLTRAFLSNPQAYLQRL